MKITGIITAEPYFGFSAPNLLGFIGVPFVGASIKMVTLNFLLFVPYGFLVAFVFSRAKLNWWKALVIGFCSSFLIEFVQAFTGRMTELDDLIINTAGFVAGFLIGDAIQKLRDSGQRKNAIFQIVLVIALSSVGLFLLSFIANGDVIQAEEDSYYNGIAGSPETLDEELAAISEMNIYSGGDKYDVYNNDESVCETWYEYFGLDINNQSSMYSVENQDNKSDLTIATDKTYIEVAFSTPQLFRFYNNHDWVMENVSYMLYCVESGELWYGKNSNSIQYHAYYKSNEYPFAIDDNLIEEIGEWVNGKSD